MSTTRRHGDIRRAETNQHGLRRYISEDIRREVRQRSKFGCVICRCGFYQYEHIDPPFEHAKQHDPGCICCLCGSCHDSVTRGHLSKDCVKAAYREVQRQPPGKIGPPIGPLDFHNGNAELAIGGLLYSPAVRTVLRYHGQDLIRVLPSERVGEPGRISAIFTDDGGEEVLRLEENEWIGSIHSWDIEVTGPRLTVRQKARRIALQLRLDPPGRIVVENLDMRFNDSHILATEEAYAVGRYISDESVSWVHAQIRITKSSPFGVGIELTDPSVLEDRDMLFRGTGKELTSIINRDIVMNSNAGILIKPLGIAIASLCGAFILRELAVGARTLSDMRRIISRHPDQIGSFIGTGKLTE